HDTTCVSPTPPTHCGPASNSVAITITGDKDAVRNVTALGFGKCYSTAAGGKGMMIEHLDGDCDGGVSIDGSHEPTQIDGIYIKPFLTNGNGDASLLTLQVVALGPDMGSAKYAPEA